MMKTRAGSGSGLWLRPGWGMVERVMVVLLLLPPSSQFHFHGLLKISQSAISFSLPTLPRYLPATERQNYPPRQQQQSLCPHNVFLLSLEKQRKRHDGGPNKLFVRRNLLRKKSVWRMTLQRRRKMSVRRIIFWIRRKRHFTAASTRSENIFTFFEYTTNSYI